MEQKNIIQMRQKEKYIRPIVTDSMELALESAILAGSVVNDINASGMKSTPQELEQLDASSAGFNHEWN